MVGRAGASDLVRLTADLVVPFAHVFRTVKLHAGSDRFETDVEHSYMLALLGSALAPRIDESINSGRVAHYALVHDLVETHAGDTTIWAAKELHASKPDREHAALMKIKSQFDSAFPWISETIARYERLDEAESCFVYALDKMVPYIVMLAIDYQPFPPSLEVYEAKIGIARAKVGRYPKLLDYFDELDKSYRGRPHFFS